MRVAASPFDSEHLGVRAAHLAVEAGDGPAELARALAAARAAHDMLFLRLPEAHSLRAAVEPAHAPLETLVTSTLDPARGPAPAAAAIPIEVHAVVRDAALVEAVVAITAAAFTGTHYHADPRLAPERVAALYAAWTRNDLGGRAQATLVAREAGTVLGYLAITGTPTKAAIDLVAVAPGAQGRGVGSALLAAFLAWVDARGAAATVGTQSHNPALALYQRWGFVPSERNVTYHLWLR